MYNFWLYVYISVVLINRGVLTLVGEIRRYRKDRYCYYHHHHYYIRQDSEQSPAS